MAEERKLKIRAREKELKGAYSNLMQVLHTKEEFVLDFFLVSPPEGLLTSRVIMSPGHCKRMTKALQENISRYEGKFGKIEEAEVPEKSIGFEVEDK
ncbi:hypothetical protein AMJ50_01315 [Parcubacteria bacterium DG_74_3]|nr:MAG: hypothetical protein AMJ50_01315 [Parcubacteria bacterium DG_74_3]